VSAAVDGRAVLEAKFLQIESKQQEILSAVHERLQKAQECSNNLQLEVSTLKSAKHVLEDATAELLQKNALLDSKLTLLEQEKAALNSKLTLLEQENHTLQGELDASLHQISALKAEVEAAYACSQTHMRKSDFHAVQHQTDVSELQKQLQSANDKSTHTALELTQYFQQTIAASQQKLVSMAAHAEAKDQRIRDLEEQLQHKEHELSQAHGQTLALASDCTRLAAANEAFQIWKTKTEAWGVEADATLQSKEQLIEG
jgi:DNA repair exonuclease SbcCD ATPase subunit